MKIDLNQKENTVTEERRLAQEKKTTKILINSVNPQPGHKLYEFRLEGNAFSVMEVEFRTEGELVFKLKDGIFQKESHPKEKVSIDIFNPTWPVNSVKRYGIKFEDGVGYVTALNYQNACKKFKQLNPEYFS